ncbi:osteoclast-stimulating factor 1-like [Biomphalaria glabrata]|uniref:Osteoclast-stimulating factor 1 n=2 Tax=Biomphalaria TaxID=6525 RepID=A0A9W3AXX5_BIOGL|nr:osteoclast-stimulating factor 1-like [Biomphalaria glabrata]KAI8770020.1 osteoclast-stimulating factor 1 [Biomphalaria glabrata]
MSNPPRPVRPPPPVPKPGQVKVVRAMYRYEAQQPDELTFDEGDTLYILDMKDPSWWKAKCGSSIGLIPSNYVEENTESIDHPLHDAAKRGNMDFMKDCLQNRVSVNGLDKAGSTPLHWAAHGGHIPCLQTLLSIENCEVNVQNKLGDTPLHSAAWKGHAEAVKMLLDKGARVDLRNNDGKLPIDLTKDADVAALLREAAGVRASRYSEGYEDEEDSD